MRLSLVPKVNEQLVSFMCVRGGVMWFIVIKGCLLLDDGDDDVISDC